MKRFLPLILMGLGLLALVGGVVYDAMFAGIPYQDPTPELAARYAYHAHVASLICRAGGGVFLFGLVAGIVRWVARWFRRPVI